MKRGPKRAPTVSRPRAKPAADLADQAAFVAPYPPSWFDRLSARLDRLPVSPYVVYGLCGSILFLVLTLLQWREGGYPAGDFRAFHAFFAIWGPFMLAMMHYLDRLAAQALEAFQPALSASPEESRDLQYRLTTLPSRTAARIGGGAVLVNAIQALIDYFAIHPAGDVRFSEFGASLFQVAPTPLSLAVTGALVIGLWLVSGTFIYHTVHQLRVISRIYGWHTRLRLLHLGPLYTFSRVTQRTAIGALVFLYGFLSTASGLRGQPALLVASAVLFAAVAAVTFAWPLVGVHRLLVFEKERRLEENTRRLEAGIADLHQRMDRRDLGGMQDLNLALASLDLERSALARIPTWPWDPGTLRGLVAALLVPIVIWAIQLGAERWLP